MAAEGPVDAACATTVSVEGPVNDALATNMAGEGFADAATNTTVAIEGPANATPATSVVIEGFADAAPSTSVAGEGLADATSAAVAVEGPAEAQLGQLRAREYGYLQVPAEVSTSLHKRPMPGAGREELPGMLLRLWQWLLLSPQPLGSWRQRGKAVCRAPDVGVPLIHPS